MSFRGKQPERVKEKRRKAKKLKKIVLFMSAFICIVAALLVYFLIIK